MCSTLNVRLTYDRAVGAVITRSLLMEDYFVEFLGPAYEESRAIEEIIGRFKATLRDPDNQDHIFEFHFGFTPDDIVWDDRWLTPTYSGNPLITECINMDELSSGEFQQITPEGIYGLMFRNGHTGKILEYFRDALSAERNSDRDEGDEELHNETMRAFLKGIHAEIKKSCRKAMRKDRAPRLDESA